VKTPLEAVLQAMISEGWANESDGNVDSPTGHFARVSNSESELPEVVDAFEDVITTYGMDDTRELIGHFLVVEDSQGFVHISAYDNPIDLTRDFQELQDAFAKWDEDNGEGE
jgi:hypothetical protein